MDNNILFSIQALGNHEFDDSIPGILPYMESLTSPIVAVNMDVSEVPELQGKYQPSIVIQRANRKIGIIGCITKYTPVSMSIIKTLNYLNVCMMLMQMNCSSYFF
jgi:2',3'-cyclic-nucleotide 2'-phosphodiesterase (5'-nucleotidase family)